MELADVLIAVFVAVNAAVGAAIVVAVRWGGAGFLAALYGAFTEARRRLAWRWAVSPGWWDRQEAPRIFWVRRGGAWYGLDSSDRAGRVLWYFWRFEDDLSYERLAQLAPGETTTFVWAFRAGKPLNVFRLSVFAGERRVVGGVSVFHRKNVLRGGRIQTEWVFDYDQVHRSSRVESTPPLLETAAPEPMLAAITPPRD